MIKNILFPIIILLLISCGKKDVLLLEQVPVSLAVNPQTKILIKDNKLVDVQLTANGIRGITQTHIFYTQDGFRNFTIAPYGFGVNANFRHVNGDAIFASPGSAVPPFIEFTPDYGNSWNLIYPNIPGFPSTGFMSNMVISYKLISNSMLMLTAKTESISTVPYPVNSAWLYTIHPATGNGTLVSSIPDHYPKYLEFIDANTGYMLLNKTVPAAGGGYTSQNTYVSKTTNGGQSWTSPVLVSATEPMRLSVGKDGHVFVYSANGGGYFSSNGTTWTKSNNNHRFNHVTIVSSSLLYATADHGFIRSTDGGLTWTDEQLYRFSNHRLVFSHELHGIAYNESALYETKDGGKTWATLLYPFPYVVN